MQYVTEEQTKTKAQHYIPQKSSKMPPLKVFYNLVNNYILVTQLKLLMFYRGKSKVSDKVQILKNMQHLQVNKEYN